MSEPKDGQPAVTSKEQEPGFEDIGDLFTSIIWYYKSSKFSDLTMHCGNQEYKVHKLVICGQSKVFSRMFNGNWKEAEENSIYLTEDNREAVEAMIQFMYGIEYGTSESKYGHSSPMLFNVKMYELGDIYGIPKLKGHAKTKFGMIVKTGWSSKDFPAAISKAYSTTPMEDRGLRDSLVTTSVKHIHSLQKKKDFTLVLKNTTGFAADLIQPMVEQKNATTDHYCQRCRRHLYFGSP